MPSAPFGGAFQGRRVLVTGHTGFKGSWLSRWLLDLGAEVTGLALEPDTAPALFEQLSLSKHIDSRIGDVRDLGMVEHVIEGSRPEIVLHLAAQPLVRRSYAEPRYTFETNVLGTLNVLETCRTSASVQAVVNVTTDKVYRNSEQGIPFSEDAPLGGHDPYSASKACSEIVSSSYRDAFFVPQGRVGHATARGGNVIGGGDWAQDRIVPDIVRALARNEPVLVRNPQSVRPWQHVLEPLSGYLTLVAALLERPTEIAAAYNFGPVPEDTRTVEDLVVEALKVWGSGTWEPASSEDAPHEASVLRLEIEQAERDLAWRPVWSFEAAVDAAVGWYRKLEDGESAEAACEQSLASYMRDASSAGVGWAA